MSVFVVDLTQGVGRTAQGALDPSVVNGASIQRTIYAPGPNKINRVLFDGQTFTDVNYWKRFTYAVTGDYSTAFINVVSDDGSVWNDFSQDNTYPVSYSTTILQGTTYSSHTSGPNQTVFNILQANGSPASFAQITRTDTNTTQFVTVRVNGTATFPLYGGTSQVFNNGDLAITKIEFDNTTSGNASAVISIFLSIQQQAQS